MDYEKLKEVIAKQIKENGKREITGPVLQAVLMAMVDSLGEVYPQTYTDEQKAQARANIDALSNHNGEITKEKLSLEVQSILNDVANKQNITDESLATIAKTIVGAINEVYNGGLKDASIATSKIKDEAVTDAKIASGAVTTPKIANDAVTTEKVNDGAITEPKLDTDLLNIITSAVQPAELASAIATALASYVAKADIVSTTGSATDKVMSQHGVTEAINGVTNTVTDLEEKVNGKQDALTLTVKDNGNIVISNIQGQSKEFMPATPSGDPMHYMYEAYGCVWNGNGDRQVVTPWAAYADDEEDKVVIHKKGYWLLNGIGDLTTDEVRKICARGLWNSSDNYPLGYSVGLNDSRTLLYRSGEQNAILSQVLSGYNTRIISINLSNENRSNELANITLKSVQNYFILSRNLKYIYGGFLVINDINRDMFKNCVALRICRIKTKKNLYLRDSPYFNNYCIRYAIENNLATENISITLHADAYTRAMADVEIIAALQAHTNVSLASA